MILSYKMHCFSDYISVYIKVLIGTEDMSLNEWLYHSANILKDLLVKQQLLTIMHDTDDA